MTPEGMTEMFKGHMNDIIHAFDGQSTDMANYVATLLVSILYARHGGTDGEGVIEDLRQISRFIEANIDFGRVRLETLQ